MNNSGTDFQFVLPPELIAQQPTGRRDGSRLLLVDGQGVVVGETGFAGLSGLLRAGDLLVLNESRVLPARLWCRRPETGGRVELLLVEPAAAPGAWRAMARPARRLRPGSRLVVEVEPTDSATEPAEPPILEVVGRDDDGFVTVAGEGDLAEVAARWGRMPLPPYIRRERENDAHQREDRERYQTVYASQAPEAMRSVAAPTAGLHFTAAVLADLERVGVEIVRVLLHVGPGTFQPPSPLQIAARRLHAESFEWPAGVSARLAAARARGGRVIAVGTTSLRVLETVARLPLPDGVPAGTEWRPSGIDCDGPFAGVALRTAEGWSVRGTTTLFIAPPDRVCSVDGLLTNFHLPGSSLLMLVAALAGDAAWRGIYEEAVARGLRFYSYGDCMLLLPGLSPEAS